jgi:hypothetical protein
MRHGGVPLVMLATCQSKQERRRRVLGFRRTYFAMRCFYSSSLGSSQREFQEPLISRSSRPCWRSSVLLLLTLELASESEGESEDGGPGG